MKDTVRQIPVEPKRLTRAIVKGGEYFRIVGLYGVTPIGARILNAYQLAVGCRSELLDEAIARDADAGHDGYYVPQSRRCSWQWYARRALSQHERMRREARARRERGERVWLALPQAS